MEAGRRPSRETPREEPAAAAPPLGADLPLLPPIPGEVPPTATLVIRMDGRVWARPDPEGSPYGSVTAPPSAGPSADSPAMDRITIAAAPLSWSARIADLESVDLTRTGLARRSGRPAAELATFRGAAAGGEAGGTQDDDYAGPSDGTRLHELLPSGDYRPTVLIGRGGQGEVWAAIQGVLDREVALKVQTRGSLREFLAEACTSAWLEHPNIAPVYDLTTIEQGGVFRPALVMKRLRGTTWIERLRGDRLDDRGGGRAGFSLEHQLAHHLPTLVAVCNAVSFAHSRRILHLDLKPHQVLLGDHGEVYLLDWGLAVTLDSESPRLPALDVPKHHTIAAETWCAGSPAYMAPEQAGLPGLRIGTHTDVYLLGATLFELLTGEPPHPGDDIAAAFDAARRNELRPLPDDLPPDLAELAALSLATDPAARPPSVGAFRDAILDHLAGAGRRRESERIVDDVLRRLDALAPQPDYAALGRLEVDIERALVAWGENGRALAARRRLARLHARAALEEGDLGRATWVAQAADDDERTAIERDAAAARRERLRVRRQRRHAVWGSAALALGLLTASWAFTLRLGAERRAALQHAATALEQASRARQANEFILSDLLRYLDPRNPRDRAVSDSILHKMVAEIDATSTHGWAPELVAEFALHLVAIAGTLHELDFGPRAAALLDRAEREAVAGATEPGGVLAAVMAWRALVAAEDGDLDAAELASARAVALRRGVSQAAASARDLPALDFFLSVRAKVLMMRRDFEGARPVVEELLRAPEGSLPPFFRHDKLAQLELGLGNLDAALAATREAFEGAGMDPRADPHPAIGHHTLWFTHLSVRLARGEHAEALRIASHLPGTIEGIYGPTHSRMVVAVGLHARALAAAGRAQEAESRYREALEMAIQLGVERTSPVAPVRFELARLVRAERGDDTEADALLDALVADAFGAVGHARRLLQRWPEDEHLRRAMQRHQATLPADAAASPP